MAALFETTRDCFGERRIGEEVRQGGIGQVRRKQCGSAMMPLFRAEEIMGTQLSVGAHWSYDESARRQAMGDAVTAARRDAEAMARAGGGRLGERFLPIADGE
jgi:hypothetical protein